MAGAVVCITLHLDGLPGRDGPDKLAAAIVEQVGAAAAVRRCVGDGVGRTPADAEVVVRALDEPAARALPAAIRI